MNIDNTSTKDFTVNGNYVVNCYGNIVTAKSDDNKHYIMVDGYDSSGWHEISENLYIELNNHA